MDPEVITEILKELLERGFVVPLHFAVIGKNGSAAIGRIEPDDDDALRTVILATHVENGVFALPINIMFVGSENSPGPARVELAADGARRFCN